jgi:Phosphotransferase enzyme family
VTPFSDRVTTPRWRADAETWIAERLSDAGLTLTGPIEQRRVRPWSTQLVVPTEGGTVWFKANCRAQAFEPSLQSLLAELAPDEVDEPLAVDQERAWMLTRDRGATLRAHRAPTLDDWERVVREAATLQRLVADHERDVLATGVPDCSPHTVPARFERMLELLGDLPEGDPAHLSADVVERLGEARASVGSAARTLSDSSLPVTLQHGDLHPGNVFAVDGRLRIFDFGDAQWASPLELLCIPWAATHDDPSIPWAKLAAAYREPWSDLLALEEVAELMAAAVVVQPVNRALTWWECLAESTDEEWAEWGEAPARHLAHVLEPWP